MSIYYILRNKILFLLALILAPVLFLLAKRRGRKYGEAPRILVIPQLTRVGDLVCATPVFKAIKKKYPKSFLAVLVTRKVSGIIKNNPHIDEIIHFQTKGYLGVLKHIRMMNFDWGVCLNPSWIGTITMLYGIVSQRVKITREGRSIGEWASDWMNAFRFLYKDHTYLPGYCLKLLEPLDIFGAEDAKEVFVSEAGERRTEEFLATFASHSEGASATEESSFENRDSSLPAGVQSDRVPLVGISITAGNKIKEWGDDKFAELAKRIVEKHKATIIFIGSKNDELRISTLIGKLKGNLSSSDDPKIGENFRSSDDDKFISATDFSLEELPSLIKRLDLYIAVDTGPIYIAEALGVPLIDIIGPVDPNEQPPCGVGRSICVLPGGEISPSSFVFKKPGRPEEHGRALKAITVDMIMEGVDKIL